MKSKQKGAAIIVGAVFLIPIAAMLHLTIEGSKLVHQRSRMNNATEAAALAVTIADRGNESQSVELARAYIESYMQDTEIDDVLVNYSQQNSENIYQVVVNGETASWMSALDDAPSRQLASQALGKKASGARDIDVMFVFDDSYMMQYPCVSQFYSSDGVAVSDPNGASCTLQATKMIATAIEDMKTEDLHSYRFGFVPFALRVLDNRNLADDSIESVLSECTSQLTLNKQFGYWEHQDYYWAYVDRGVLPSPTLDCALYGEGYSNTECESLVRKTIDLNTIKWKHIDNYVTRSELFDCANTWYLVEYDLGTIYDHSCHNYISPFVVPIAQTQALSQLLQTSDYSYAIAPGIHAPLTAPGSLRQINYSRTATDPQHYTVVDYQATVDDWQINKGEKYPDTVLSAMTNNHLYNIDLCRARPFEFNQITGSFSPVIDLMPISSSLNTGWFEQRLVNSSVLAINDTQAYPGGSSIAEGLITGAQKLDIDSDSALKLLIIFTDGIEYPNGIFQQAAFGDSYANEISGHTRSEFIVPSDTDSESKYLIGPSYTYQTPEPFTTFGALVDPQYKFVDISLCDKIKQDFQNKGHEYYTVIVQTGGSFRTTFRNLKKTHWQWGKLWDNSANNNALYTELLDDLYDGLVEQTYDSSDDLLACADLVLSTAIDLDAGGSCPDDLNQVCYLNDMFNSFNPERYNLMDMIYRKLDITLEANSGVAKLFKE